VQPTVTNFAKLGEQQDSGEPGESGRALLGLPGGVSWNDVLFHGILGPEAVGVGWSLTLKKP
jgi:hypothetical protein